MSQNTKIEWADDTVSWWHGCQKIAEGCKFCYAERLSEDFRVKLWGAGSARRYIAGASSNCERLERLAALEGNTRLVFVNSMSDFFEEGTHAVVDHMGQRLCICPKVQRGLFGDTGDEALEVTASAHGGSPLTLRDLREEAFRLFDDCPSLRFLLLTKRPENIPAMWRDFQGESLTKFRENIWLGTSVAVQADFDKNAPELRKCRALASVLFLSVEPLLSVIEMRDGALDLIDWAIIGVESDGQRVGRLGDFKTEQRWIEGAIDIVRQCRDAGVACFVKQVPLNGRVSHYPSEWPAELRVRQYPLDTAHA